VNFFYGLDQEDEMDLFKRLEEIEPADAGWAAKARDRVDHLAKLVGSMGQLEDYYVRLCGIQRTMKPDMTQRAIVVLSADHGVVAEGVSPCDPVVTLKQTLNFARGVTGVCALAKQAGARVIPVDIGVAAEVCSDQIIHRKIRYGTANMAEGPAMTREEAIRSIEVGIEIALMAVSEGSTVLGTGEMGIGNTTPSAAMLSVFSQVAPQEVTGIGSNAPEAMVLHKIDVIERAIELNRPNPQDPIDVLSKVGGLEIGGMAGVMIGGAMSQTPVIVDGFISSVAALLAVRLKPEVLDYLFPSHKSREKGAALASALLGFDPPLDLQMRLGEGTGAALMFNVLESAVFMSNEMITCEEAEIAVI
jgi:nicotinate-nucleotide--dimethylbenzimidazole phosphoribosyltransferase